MPSSRQRRGTHETPPSLGRSNITACFRCRQKKKRCDQRLPRCTLCETTGAECVGYDAVARRNVPRSYILSLEERIAQLEQKLQEHGIHDYDSQGHGTMSTRIPPNEEAQTSDSWQFGMSPDSVTPQANSPSFHMEPMAEVQRVVAMSQHRSENEPTLSKILLEELMNLKTKPQMTRFRLSADKNEAEHLSSNMMNHLDSSPVSLPPKEAAQNLVSAYFQFAKSAMPLLHEPTFRQRLELVYSKPGLMISAELQLSSELLIPVFMVFEVFAVALTIMQKQDPTRIPISMADRYHKTAVRALSKAGIPNNVEGVQALLLIGQYSYHHPTIWAVWKTVGAALRLAVELRLHNDPSSPVIDALTADTIRRTFWVAYSMDRNVSIALGIPTCLSDGAITTKFPSEVDDEYITPVGITVAVESSFWGKGINHQLLRFRRIQSEMQTVLYERLSSPCPPIDLHRWQKEMHVRIQKWYDSVPRRDDASRSERITLENFELTFYRAVLYLYHPSANIPSPTEPALMVLAECTPQIIRLYRRCFDERRLSVYWQAVENLSSAGIALMYSYTKSSKVRQLMTMRSLETLIRMCSSVLWGMTEHFPSSRERRDAFDVVASSTLADLAAHPATAGDTNTVSRLEDAILDNPGYGQADIHNAFAEVNAQKEYFDGEPEPAMDFQAIGSAQAPQTQDESYILPTLVGEPVVDNMNLPPPPWDMDGQSFDWDALEYTGEFIPPAWI